MHDLFPHPFSLSRHWEGLWTAQYIHQHLEISCYLMLLDHLCAYSFVTTQQLVNVLINLNEHNHEILLDVFRFKRDLHDQTEFCFPIWKGRSLLQKLKEELFILKGWWWTPQLKTMTFLTWCCYIRNLRVFYKWFSLEYLRKRKVGRFSYPCIIHSQVCNETHEEKLCIYQEEERPNTRVVSGVIFQCEDVFL